MRGAALEGAALALVAYLAASVWLLGDGLRARAEAVLAASPEVLVQGRRLGRHALSTSEDAGVAAELPGVIRVEARLWGYHRDPYTGQVLTLRGLPAGHPAAPAPGTAVLGTGVAAAHGVEEGGTLTLVHPSGAMALARVARVLPAEASLVAGDTVVLPEAELRQLFDVPPGLATDLALTLASPSELDRLRPALARRLPHHVMFTRSRLRQRYAAALDWRRGFLATPLALAGLCFLLLVLARARRPGTGEFAVALGAPLTGYLAAYLHLFHGGGGPLISALAGWSVLRPAPVPVPAVHPGGLLAFLAAAALPYLLAAHLGARRERSAT